MLTQKAKYALKALKVLAHHYNTEPMLIATISEQEGIPIKFLQSILLQLKQNHILISKKGKGGGYALAHKPKATNIATILRIIDGPIALLPCASLHFYKRCLDCKEADCTIRNILASTRDATLKILEKKTLKDL